MSILKVEVLFFSQFVLDLKLYFSIVQIKEMTEESCDSFHGLQKCDTVAILQYFNSIFIETICS